MAWHGKVWHGMIGVWHGMVWHGRGMAWHVHDR